MPEDESALTSLESDPTWLATQVVTRDSDFATGANIIMMNVNQDGYKRLVRELNSLYAHAGNADGLSRLALHPWRQTRDCKTHKWHIQGHGLDQPPSLHHELVGSHNLPYERDDYYLKWSDDLALWIAWKYQERRCIAGCHVVREVLQVGKPALHRLHKKLTAKDCTATLELAP